MRFSSTFVSATSALLFATSAFALDESLMWVNAVVGQNNVSTVECWGLAPPLLVSQNPETKGARIAQLGNFVGLKHVSYPAGDPVNAGLHNSPFTHYVTMLAGSATMSFPESGADNLTVKAGDIFIGADTADVSTVGHWTIVDGGSVIVQLPFENGVVPEHEAIAGPCA